MAYPWTKANIEFSKMKMMILHQFLSWHKKLCDLSDETFVFPPKSTQWTIQKNENLLKKPLKWCPLRKLKSHSNVVRIVTIVINYTRMSWFYGHLNYLTQFTLRTNWQWTEYILMIFHKSTIIQTKGEKRSPKNSSARL